MYRKKGKRLSPARPGHGSGGILGFFAHPQTQVLRDRMATIPLEPSIAVTTGSPSLLLPSVLVQPEKAKAREFAWYLLPGDLLQVLP